MLQSFFLITNTAAWHLEFSLVQYYWFYLLFPWKSVYPPFSMLQCIVLIRNNAAWKLEFPLLFSIVKWNWRAISLFSAWCTLVTRMCQAGSIEVTRPYSHLELLEQKNNGLNYWRAGHTYYVTVVGVFVIITQATVTRQECSNSRRTHVITYLT